MKPEQRRILRALLDKQVKLSKEIKELECIGDLDVLVKREALYKKVRDEFVYLYEYFKSEAIFS